MRLLATALGISVAAFALSGCVAVDVASAVVDVGATAVSTTASVAGSAVKGVGHVVAGGSSDEDKKKDGDYDN